MRVTEQIDALRTLATHPIDYLVVPRLIAAQIALPLLTIESICVGIGSGYLVCVHLLGIEPTYLWQNMLRYSHDVDVMIGLVKAFIFGHTHNWNIEQHPSGVHLVNLPQTAYPFQAGRPSGWVRATLARDSAEFELRCLDPHHPEHAKVTRLKWRTA